MNIKGIAVIILTGISSGAFAQSLDIGGVELRLGQDVSEAIKSLSMYKVTYIETAQSWFVFRPESRTFSPIGNVSAKNNKINWISKSYDVDQNSNLSLVYASASNELRRRAGTSCAYKEREIGGSEVNGYLHIIEKHCGFYNLSLGLPSKHPNGNVISGGVELILTIK